MDTVVGIALSVPATAAPRWSDAVRRAFNWFAAVEQACSRFDPDSEVSRLATEADRPVRVSPMLFEILKLGRAVAEATGGAFNPAVGHLMEAAGYDRHYRTGARRRHDITTRAPSYRDIELDERAGTVWLRRPLLLDLGGVAKGVAIDLAVRELSAAPGVAIDAGGDVRVRGTCLSGGPWRVAVADPRSPGSFLRVLEVADGALATSGECARGPHILTVPSSGDDDADDPVGSVSVLAPDAALADALSTAAFALGIRRGLDLLERTDSVSGLFVSRAGRIVTTSGFPPGGPQWQ